MAGREIKSKIRQHKQSENHEDLVELYVRNDGKCKSQMTQCSHFTGNHSKTSPSVCPSVSLAVFVTVHHRYTRFSLEEAE